MGILFEIVVQHLAEQEKEARTAPPAGDGSEHARAVSDRSVEPQAESESTEQPVY